MSSTTSPTLMLGRVAAEPGSAFVSAVEVMNYIFAVATDTIGWGTVSTIERVTMQAARQLATPPTSVNPSRTSA